MHGRRRRLLFSILSLVFLLSTDMAGDEGGDAARFGVVVEEVAPGSGAHKAGVQPGDVIVSWSRAPTPPANPEAAEGAIASSFDLAGVQIEQVHRGPVVLAGRRGEIGTSWTLPRLDPGLTVRPPLAPGLLALYQEGKDLIGAKKTVEGVARWRAAAVRARDEGQGLVGAWLAGGRRAGPQRGEELDGGRRGAGGSRPGSHCRFPARRRRADPMAAGDDGAARPW